jgi:hypothetical protein
MVKRVCGLSVLLAIVVGCAPEWEHVATFKLEERADWTVPAGLAEQIEGRLTTYDRSADLDGTRWECLTSTMGGTPLCEADKVRLVFRPRKRLGPVTVGELQWWHRDD